MAARSIASLSLGFGLVSIPVKLYSATESSEGLHFNFLHKCGSRVKQQYVCVKEDIPVERSELVKGYEFEKDRYVMFEPGELKALEEGSRHTIDIVSFVPLAAVDPIYYDKAYFVAPDKRGAKSYGLLMDAMQQSGRCALATWAWKGKQYVVQVRPGDGGLVLQQLLYAQEVRSMKELDIERVPARPGELQLALQLIEQISVESYEPGAFKDEEKDRVKAAIDEKIAGKEIVVTEAAGQAASKSGGQVIDLMEALRASLGGGKRASRGAARTATSRQPAPTARRSAAKPDRASEASAVSAAKDRKPPKRAIERATERATERSAAPTPARARAAK